MNRIRNERPKNDMHPQENTDPDDYTRDRLTIDIYDFKNVYDTLGNRQGDSVIAGVGRILMERQGPLISEPGTGASF